MTPKRRIPLPGSTANIRFDFYMTDYEWLALRDIATSMGYSKTLTLLTALERLSEETLGYNLLALYRNQVRKEGAPPPCSSRRKPRARR